jgi:hypothetical protein
VNTTGDMLITAAVPVTRSDFTGDPPVVLGKKILF